MKKSWSTEAINRLLARREKYKGTLKNFCKSEGFSSSYFYQLKKRISDKRANAAICAKSITKSSIVKLIAAPEENQDHIEISFPTGYSLKLFGNISTAHLQTIISSIGALSK